jgi:uncharacterized protein YbjT (DUF2867 family)
MYTVFGATGNTGSVVAQQLLLQGQKVRAVVRDKGKAEALARAGAELVTADLRDVSQLAAALRGSEGAYVMLPPRHDSADMLASARSITDALARALVESGMPHVVLLSSLGAELDAGTGPILSARYAEEALGKTGVVLSVLRPPYFMDNWAESLGALESGVLPSMLALDHAIPTLATEDIGRFAAAILREGPRGNRVIELTGPRDYTPRDVAAALSKLLGRTITPEAVPNQAIPGVLTGFGMSASDAELFRAMHEGIDSGRIGFQQQGATPLRGEVTMEQVLRRLLKL